METPQELSFLAALLPLAIVIFFITLGVVVLNQHFHKNLIRQKLEQEEIKNRHQQELLKSSIQIQEEERKRMARDLHDEMGAVLSIARMHILQLARSHAIHYAGQSLETIQTIQDLIESSLASVRRISHELMPPQLENFGLIKVLESLTAASKEKTETSIRLEVTDSFPRLPWRVELGLYRIITELITNSLKHASATAIHIHLESNQNKIVLIYQDNGKGLPEPILYGLGHKSIEARATSMGGILEIFNLVSGGMCATLTLNRP
jgi:signal transduction histidine kinase